MDAKLESVQLRLDELIKIDEICDLFEARWMSSTPPDLSDFLASLDAEVSKELLMERLIPIDIKHRQRKGMPVDHAAYARLSDWGGQIAKSYLQQESTGGDTEAREASGTDVEKVALPSTDTTMPPSTVVTFGPYVVLNKVAEHGQGIVYRANHPTLNRQVVIKVSKAAPMNNQPDALLEEARSLAKLNHPHVASVFDLQRHSSGQTYLVMEFIEGRDLATLLREKQFSISETIGLLSVVCEGIQHAHDLGILHLDLKPANIVIRAADKAPKIIDFGMAQTRSVYGNQDPHVIGGTWQYMAPEQAEFILGRGSLPNGEQLDSRADVFAIGVILYEMLTGQPLRSGTKSSPYDAFRHAKSNQIDFQPLTQKHIPKKLRTICINALATNRRERIASAGELATLLKEVAAPAPKWPAFAVATVALILVCFFILWAVGSGDKNGVVPPIVKADVQPEVPKVKQPEILPTKVDESDPIPTPVEEPEAPAAPVEEPKPPAAPAEEPEPPVAPVEEPAPPAPSAAPIDETSLPTVEDEPVSAEREDGSGPEDLNEAIPTDLDLPQKGVAFLKTYCQRCHGDDFKYPGLDVTNLATLLRPNDDSEAPFIVAGNADESRLWDVVDSEYMPPERQPQPTAEEKQMFRNWIESGAHFPTEDRPQREFLGEESVLAAIEADLRNLADDEVPYIRYFSLAHLWNDIDGKEPTTEEDLRLVRAGLSKLINSLSSKSRIVVPRVVDGEFATVLAIDMRDYGWDEWHWNEVLKAYPYGLKVSSQSATNIYRLTQTRVPYLRADWFIANASRPPLYHSLLNIPSNAKALEADLGVNIYKNFESGQLVRAAFQKSGVSQQNRMLERHDTSGGGRYYWKSYDMLPGTGEVGDFTRRPLGPVFEQQTSTPLAPFRHDGGEIIWSLPNGLQGYMLVTGEDVRIDEGPIQVVFDPNAHSGSVTIVNGISCMGCHKHGMFPWEKDDIRPLFEDKRGQAVADKVLELFPSNDEMRKLVRSDQQAFMLALEEAIGPFVKIGNDAGKPIQDFPEPITRVSNRYQQDITLEIAAREMGRAGENSDVLKGPRLLRELGLGNWLNPSGTVSREAWEEAYGRLARELGIGIPVRVR